MVDKENDEYNINKEKVEKDNEENDKLKKLNEDLKQAIKEERYEEAAKIRDEIKSMNKEQKVGKVLWQIGIYKMEKTQMQLLVQE